MMLHPSTDHWRRTLHSTYLVEAIQRLTGVAMSRPHSSPERTLPSLRSVLPEQFQDEPERNVGRGGVRPHRHRRERSHTLQSDGTRSVQKELKPSRVMHTSIDTPALRDELKRADDNVQGHFLGVLRPRRIRSKTDPYLYGSHSLPSSPSAPRLPPPQDGHVFAEPTNCWVPMDRNADGHGGKRHQCPYCSKCFNRPSSLAIHLNSHTGVKPFICPICRRAFSVNSNMRRHYRNHGSSAASDAPSFGPGLPEGVSMLSPFSTTPLPPFPRSASTTRPSLSLPSASSSSQSDSDCDDGSETGSESSYVHSCADVEDARTRLTEFSVLSKVASIPRAAAGRYDSGDWKPRAPCSVPGCRCGGQSVSTALRPAVYDDHGSRHGRVG